MKKSDFFKAFFFYFFERSQMDPSKRVNSPSPIRMQDQHFCDLLSKEEKNQSFSDLNPKVRNQISENSNENLNVQFEHDK